MRAALGDDDAHNGGATAQAGVAFAVIDLQVVAVPAGLAPDVLMAAKGGAAMFDAHFQHGADGFMQPGNFLWSQRFGPAQGMNTGAEERLIGVDVADAGHQALIEQERLDLAGTPG